MRKEDGQFVASAHNNPREQVTTTQLHIHPEQQQLEQQQLEQQLEQQQLEQQQLEQQQLEQQQLEQQQLEQQLEQHTEPANPTVETPFVSIR
jgi:hypothetical protein